MELGSASVQQWVNAAVPTPRGRGPRGLSMSVDNLDLWRNDGPDNQAPTIGSSMENLLAKQTPKPVSILKKRDAKTPGDGCRSAKRIRFGPVVQYASKSTTCLPAVDVDVVLQNPRNLQNGSMMQAKSMPMSTLNIQTRTPNTLTRLAKADVIDINAPYLDKDIWKGLSPVQRLSVLAQRNGIPKSKTNPLTKNCDLKDMDKFIVEFLKAQKYTQIPANIRAQANTSDDFFKWVQFIWSWRWVEVGGHRYRALRVAGTEGQQLCRAEQIEMVLKISKRINFQPSLKRNDILNPMAPFCKPRTFTFLTELIVFVRRQ